MAPETPQQYPLYDATLTLQRISPLYIGSDTPLENATLQIYAQQFRDILAGDVLRGVRVGLSEDTSIARVGALQTVTWKLLPDEDVWTGADETQMTGNEDTTTSLAASRGMQVTITYEKGDYTAILLRDMQGDQDESAIGVGLDGYGFQSFPLLLMKMPATLRDPFTQFLADTFDARASTFRLPSLFLTTALDQYLAYICVGEDGEPLDTLESSRILRTIIGSISVEVGFDIPGGSTTLKTIQIHIASEDVPRMVSRGKRLVDGPETPFMAALTAYVKAHLALDLSHDMVNIVGVHCQAFLLNSAGKAKFGLPHVADDGESPQRRATKRLIHGLIATAKKGR
ncbi:hypothetical protein LHYA1_G007929 [Lachnellula hyalina]|uniref:Uncharacterized protein n=1 Tax=Lachnellula hyalina TaxID=1316788 RepID=A0A8H8QX58_9HELO|nr:uncharacterized protein LHYA1_G007929 [Lachnellula hyalina]TVY24318.1 hypothetical protein LHYA1_G007929 [Lachnellula hyalina]